MSISELTTASVLAPAKSIFYYVTMRNREDRQQLYERLKFQRKLNYVPTSNKTIISSILEFTVLQ